MTGSDPGEDVYVLGTGFTYHEVVLPRKTLLQIIQALEKKRAEFPEPPFPWLFRLDPYFFSPAEGEQELIGELEERAVAFWCMQEQEVDEAVVSATQKELLRDLEAAGIFSEVYSKQCEASLWEKQEWLERWDASKLLAYHRDLVKFLTHFRRRVQPPVGKQMVPAPVLGASISVGAWKPQWL